MTFGHLVRPFVTNGSPGHKGAGDAYSFTKARKYIFGVVAQDLRSFDLLR